ncbi:dTDP-4-dehydrorhamnose 3,5-epimerase family protein [Flaviflexus equikiangi]|uniref:dTDP-4-dehydrorhamnose 3,5-epimerase family protein n=1 Tax=Flaviflexus equikiangi TaxID=2758573 RepID=A0ABS2TIB8_9ACTO|nr:dTDP-4-dehydrorhamnose 3,5-epimerase family protein [Flaviflexus equikiangi]MBM9433858.1 dTDP-4-dehydrorhamnose 3,5-epimerase family protein [Flaviflexus equikiangi]
MDITPLSISGAWHVESRQFADNRGTFLEAFHQPTFKEATGRSLSVAQVNTSVSAAGTIRGIHFADVPPSQAKYVFCTKGAILDVVIDIRTGSPTFGQYDTVLLDDVERNAIFISEGLGHAFISLEDGSVATYLCSTPYSPTREHGINPLCKTIGIEWPTTDRGGNPITPILSDKDRDAPGLLAAQEQGLLPTLALAEGFVAGQK